MFRGGVIVNFLAHYDAEKGIEQLLKKHLKAVAELIYQQVPPSVQFKNIANPEIKNICYWMGCFHDIGKYTSYFYEYLKYKKHLNSPKKNHAHISACFTYLFLKNHPDVSFSGTLKKEILFLVYLCVRLHHRSLSLERLFPFGKEKTIWSDLRNLEVNLGNRAEEIVEDIKWMGEITPEQFESYLEVSLMQEDEKNFIYMPEYFLNGRVSDAQWFFMLTYLFSVLIDTDKLDAGNLILKEVKNVPPHYVNEYLHKKHGQLSQSTLVNQKEKARQNILKVIDGLTDKEIKSNLFFTLTAPTGIGKTLASLQCALRLQERIKSLENYTPRIITAIPFINIIEQTKKDYEEICKEDNLRLVINHSMADFYTKSHQKEEIPLDKVLLEVESWEGDIILTTFVQLFHSIFTGKNRPLKKLNKLAGSIIILDEVQSLPEKYMPLIGAVLCKIAQYYGSRFILMTATQPKLLEFADLLLTAEKQTRKPAVSLLPHHKEYFKQLHRTKLVPLLQKKINTEEFLDLLKEKWDKKQSVLIVVNTIKRSIEIFAKIKKYLENERLSANDEVKVYYLSTNIIPAQRRKVIAEVKKQLEAEKTVILVSTQTIEAGVDLDFQMAFRDFAPLESLIQTAGRVNREGKYKNYRPVYIIQLESDNHFIYQLMHRQSTWEFLTKDTEILEFQYVDLMEKYYSQALERGVSDESKSIWEEGILKLDFSKIQEFQLIERPGEVVDVLAEMKEEKVKLLIDAYEEIIKYQHQGKFNFDLSKVLSSSLATQFNKKLNHYEKKAILRLILAQISDYIIQVRASRLKENSPIEFKQRGGVSSSFSWIPPEQLGEYYNEETGFISETGKAFVY